MRKTGPVTRRQTAEKLEIASANSVTTNNNKTVEKKAKKRQREESVDESIETSSVNSSSSSSSQEEEASSTTPSSPPPSSTKDEDTNVEADTSLLRDLLVSWGEDPQALIPEQLPKHTVSITGTMSAGKSSFVNDFYGIRVQAEERGETDTNFTIVETVSEEEFQRVVEQYFYWRYQGIDDFTEEDLQKELKSHVGHEADERHGRCFYFLTHSQTLERYNSNNNNSSGGSGGHYFSNELKKDLERYHSLFGAILINEAIYDKNLALKDDPMRQHLARQTILIDSPGIKRNRVEEAIKHVVTHSDQNLFLIGSDCINNRETRKAVDTLQKALDLQKPSTTSTSSTNSTNGVASAIWDKTLFLLTKIDLLETKKEEKDAYYYLGQLFGSQDVAGPPTRKIYHIALPHKVTNGRSTGDYETLMQMLVGRSFVTLKAERSSRIARVCDVLEAKMRRSLRTKLQWFMYFGRTDYQQVVALRDKYRLASRLNDRSRNVRARVGDENNDDSDNGDNGDEKNKKSEGSSSEEQLIADVAHVAEAPVDDQ